MQTLSSFVPWGSWGFGANLQASTLPQVASTEEDGRVVVFLNCFACSELWATSEFALV